MRDNGSTVSPQTNQLEVDGRTQTSHGRPSHAPDVDYLTVLAHDLRNYLTPVHAHLERLLARAQHEQRESDLRAAARSQQALAYAFNLISSILETARLEHGLFALTLNRLRLDQMVEQAIDVFELERTLILLRTSEPITLCGDDERLRQALHNLIANAIAHSPRGLPITLDLTTTIRAGNPWAVLAIRNEGPGIPPHLLPHLFQRFTAGTDSRGLGLELYLARGIVEAHGGTLTAHSAEGAGACFTLSVPITHASI